MKKLHCWAVALAMLMPGSALAYECEVFEVLIELDDDEICDGFEDCDDGSDEVGCDEEPAEEGGELSEDTIYCDDGSEVEGEYCDEYEDCADGSDEADCDPFGEEEGDEAGDEEGDEAGDEEGGALSDALAEEGCSTSGQGTPFGWILLAMAGALVALRRRASSL